MFISDRKMKKILSHKSTSCVLNKDKDMMKLEITINDMKVINKIRKLFSEIK